jgi:hypothetical protein
MEPGGVTEPGQPFIYAFGTQRIRFLGSELGEPFQVSNRAHDAGDPRVSFVLRPSAVMKGEPLVWQGSPSPSAQNDGAASDVWALFDPEVTQREAATSVTATGLNRNFEFGGLDFQGPPLTTKAWISGPSLWSLASNAPSHTVTTGTVAGGNLTDVRFVEGKYATIEKGVVPNPISPGVVLQVEEQIDPLLVGSPTMALGVRGSAQFVTQGGFTARLQIWRWASSEWKDLGASFLLRPYMLSRSSHEVVGIGNLVGWTDVAPYVDTNNGNRVRARLTVAKTGPAAATNWKAGVEALRVLTRP